MSYVTVEVEIDHGGIVPREPTALPEKGSGLMTILQPEPGADGRTRRPFGLAKGQVVVPGDFNAPLPEDFSRGFEGA
jgi:hypothetical protein